MEGWADDLERFRQAGQPGQPDGPRLPATVEASFEIVEAPNPEPTRPWERMESEPGRAFEAFRIFRDLGPTRTLAATALSFFEIPASALTEDPNIGKRYAPRFYAWHSKYNWKVRADSWDAEIDRQRWADRAEAIRRTNDGYVAVGAAMRQKILLRVAGMDPAQIAPKDVPAWIKAAADVERMGYGITSTSTVQVTGPDGGPIQHEHNIDEAAVDDRIGELLTRQGLTIREIRPGRTPIALPPGEDGTPPGVGGEGADTGSVPPSDYQDGDFKETDYP
jgi:hypothetical protein